MYQDSDTIIQWKEDRAVLYELGEDVELSNDSQIMVDGTDNFKISFLKR